MIEPQETIGWSVFDADRGEYVDAGRARVIVHRPEAGEVEFDFGDDQPTLRAGCTLSMDPITMVVS